MRRRTSIPSARARRCGTSCARSDLERIAEDVALAYEGRTPASVRAAAADSIPRTRSGAGRRTRRIAGATGRPSRRSVGRAPLDCASVERQRAAHRRDGLLDVVVGVRRRGDERLAEHAAPKQLLQEQRAIGLRRRACRRRGWRRSGTTACPRQLHIVAQALLANGRFDTRRRAAPGVLHPADRVVSA